jgi:hypothetical protein
MVKRSNLMAEPYVSSPQSRPDEQPRPAPVRIGVRLAVMAIALIVGVGLVECGLRLFVPVTDLAFYFWDPALGPRRVPQQAGRYLFGHIDARYHYNAQGWNHRRDYTVARPSGVRRIAIVGDSYVEAMQVNPEQTMFAVAEQRMTTAARPVEWYAFGLSGWGTTQEYAAIRHYVLDYRPDVVVLFFDDNDVFDSATNLMPIEPYIVTYNLDDEGALVLRPPSFWAPSPMRRFGAQSALVRYFTQQHPLWRPSTPSPAAVPLREGSVAAAAANHGKERWRDPDEQRKAWQLITKTLEAARDESRRRGAELVVVFRGGSAEIEAPFTGKAYQPPPRPDDPYCLGSRLGEMGREFVAPITASLGIPYFDLTEPLRQMVARTHQSHRFPEDAHYNAAAHEAAGRALADWLQSLDLGGQPIR